jgi:hypothetical protein
VEFIVDEMGVNASRIGVDKNNNKNMDKEEFLV